MKGKRAQLFGAAVAGLLWFGVYMSLYLGLLPTGYAIVALGNGASLLTLALWLICALLGVYVTLMLSGALFTHALANPESKFSEALGKGWRPALRYLFGLALLVLTTAVLSGLIALLIRSIMGEGERAKTWVDVIAAVLGLLALPLGLFVGPALFVEQSGLFNAIANAWRALWRRPVKGLLLSFALYGVGLLAGFLMPAQIQGNAVAPLSVWNILVFFVMGIVSGIAFLLIWRIYYQFHVEEEKKDSETAQA